MLVSALLILLPACTCTVGGCEGCADWMTFQGVVVTNTMEGTTITVVKTGAYERSKVYGKNVAAGEGCFVPADPYIQYGTIAVTVVARDASGNYLGSVVRRFDFSSYSGYTRIEPWEVTRGELKK